MGSMTLKTHNSPQAVPERGRQAGYFAGLFGPENGNDPHRGKFVLCSSVGDFKISRKLLSEIGAELGLP